MLESQVVGHRIQSVARERERYGWHCGNRCCGIAEFHVLEIYLPLIPKVQESSQAQGGGADMYSTGIFWLNRLNRERFD